MPKAVDHEARRAELLAATWRVIARDGIEGATVRRISREAGYSTGVLTHYFQNKEDVLRTALQASFTQTRTRMAADTASSSGVASLRNAAWPSCRSTTSAATPARSASASGPAPPPTSPSPPISARATSSCAAPSCG